jgi:hypothetical protein
LEYTNCSYLNKNRSINIKIKQKYRKSGKLEETGYYKKTRKNRTEIQTKEYRQNLKQFGPAHFESLYWQGTCPP